MSPAQRFTKRAFDLALAAPGLVVSAPVIAIAAMLARRDTGASGIFRQQRIGRHGRPFTVYKIRTMRAVEGTSVTTVGDARITPLGARLRRWKIDELPQLWNVVKGEMSFVGPRPDVAGFADTLEGADREVLELRPGITGPATLKYRNEEQLLSEADDPEAYNREVIWPDKVAINRDYLHHYSLARDIAMIWQTVARR
ncbi:sugar transferase [Erythrobacter sp. SDW2]|uniref:sugar transferase n=1 Tax=Erythrobacter sp. SDW2 TaxID=2907154 RepID=UPI001F2522D3|nr:sugar transferase [Erythrobacter sp. SDW2]UIP07378.1 sugar transferase [Erythrobacter sp. SDW2]